VRLRLEQRWVSPPVQEAAPVLEATGVRPGPVHAPQGERVRLEVPSSIAALRDQDLEVALAWRLSTREAFQRCFEAGYAAVDFVRWQGRGFYVLERRA